MQPNHCDLLGQVRNQSRTRMTRQNAQSPSPGATLRTEDSWIDVSSQPSSSSLSSVDDDIITTGLRVQQQGSHPSRSRSHRHVAQEPSSSQDEYEESESESDPVLSSSNEEVNRQPSRNPLLQLNGSPLTLGASSDDDDNSTTLGTRISTSRFVPQPNVFSHPPASRNPSWTRAMDSRRPEPSEGESNASRRTAGRMNSQASMRSNRSPRQNQQHSPFNMLSPSHQADHDAALRASLSTLLSCAAAARGLPKSESQQLSTDPSRPQPSSFRLVPESAMQEDSSDEGAPPAVERNISGGPAPPRKHPNPGPSYPSPAAPVPKKRRSSSPKARGAGNQSACRKNRRSILNESLSANTTVMTWVVSAGVVVLFSAISFSAGYMLGREVGRMEMGPGMTVGDGGTTSATCGQRAVKGGLKRFRWGSSGAGSGILA